MAIPKSMQAKYDEISALIIPYCDTYLGPYCNDEELEKRLRARPEWQSQNPDGFINAMKGFNAMYRFYGEDGPKMDKIDTSDISLEESSRQVMDWISRFQN